MHCGLIRQLRSELRADVRRDSRSGKGPQNGLMCILVACALSVGCAHSIRPQGTHVVFVRGPSLDSVRSLVVQLWAAAAAGDSERVASLTTRRAPDDIRGLGASFFEQTRNGAFVSYAQWLGTPDTLAIAQVLVRMSPHCRNVRGTYDNVLTLAVRTGLGWRIGSVWLDPC